MSAPTGNSSLEQPLPEYEFQRQVLKSLNILRMNLQQQGDLISSLVPLQASSPAAPLVVTEPFHSVELLESFQHHLTNQKEEQLYRELAVLGGSSVKTAVKRIMCHLFTDDVAEKFSWEGKKGKLVFKELKFPGIIMRAVHANKTLANATNFEVESEIKGWLRHAKDRRLRQKTSG
ncbi:uncharacterized protein LOC135400932 [Ornithodoros turicata]|uniref:uncharacterized protein LOC135400932 n=1 Tax=Ornithodoros turicata TaxID=34597 RepID=UPI003139EEC3